MCTAPKIPDPPPAPPPPPPPEEVAKAVKTDPKLKKKQRMAARYGTSQLKIPLTNSLNIPQ